MLRALMKREPRHIDDVYAFAVAPGIAVSWLIDASRFRGVLHTRIFV
jgi:hypothetical protein